MSDESKASWLLLITHHSLLLRDWDSERERGTLADFGLDADLAAVEFDELARDVEAEAGALLAARGAGARLRVLVEDVALVFGGDADSGVGDRDADERAFARRADVDAPALGRELQSVRDEVDEDATELGAVGLKLRQFRGQLGFERDLLLGGEREHLLVQLFDEDAEVHRRG